MSEGNAVANEALRVEFSIFLKLYRGAPHKPGELSPWEVYCKFYLGAPRKLRDKPSPSPHGHWCCVSGSGPRRLLIASRPNAPLRGLNVGLCGDR